MSKKGFLTVEAAIFLPFFLIAMICLICLIRLIGVEENLMHIYSKQAQKIAKEAYISELNVLPENTGIDSIENIINQAYIKLSIREEIEKAEIKTASDVRLEDFRYLYCDNGISGVISGNLSYKTIIPLPMNLNRTLDFEERLVFRGFIGSTDCYEPMEYIKMEQEEDSDIVYVFPKAGERYHKHDCVVIEVYPEKVLLSPSLRSAYPPCSLCCPDALANGCIVYCFKKTGKVYHRGSCSTVTRYVVPVDRQKAMDEGYTCCNLCGG